MCKLVAAKNEKKKKKKKKKINPQANKKKYEKCHNFYLWHQKFLIPTPEEKLGAKQGLLPATWEFLYIHRFV